VVRRRDASEVVGQVGIGTRVGIHRRLGEHDQVDRVLDALREREVAPRQVARVLFLLRELTVLVVALHERDAQRPDRRGLRPRHHDHTGRHREQRDARDRASQRDSRDPRPRRGQHVGQQCVERDDGVRDERETAEARNVTGERDVVERVADLAPRETLQREARDAGVGDDPDRGRQPRRPEAESRQPADARTRERPVGRDRGDEGNDRDRAEVPRPREQDPVVHDAGDERERGAAARARLAPGVEQRHQRDERERSEVERRPGECEEQPGGDGECASPQPPAAQAQSRQSIRFSSANW
jgi:hypothetical protein